MTVNDTRKPVREIRINPFVPSESVLVATARGMRPHKAEEIAPREARARGEEYQGCEPSSHRHLEFCPRTSIPTGFELGSGPFVCTARPDGAGEKLRAVAL